MWVWAKGSWTNQHQYAMAHKHADQAEHHACKGFNIFEGVATAGPVQVNTGLVCIHVFFCGGHQRLRKSILEPGS